MNPFTYLLVILLFIAPLSHATEMKEGVNYCHDPESVAKNKALLGDHPSDLVIIRLIALRDGLCNMIDSGQITVDQGIDIFSDEKSKSIVQRSKEVLTQTPYLSI